jgi:hypothetical protein
MGVKREERIQKVEEAKAKRPEKPRLNQRTVTIDCPVKAPWGCKACRSKKCVFCGAPKT